MDGERLKSIRALTGLSQAEFCGIVGLTVEYLSRLENGKHKPGHTLTMIYEMIERCELPWRYWVAGYAKKMDR
jgi:transcriptional regulator with XRE-family HTH domain